MPAPILIAISISFIAGVMIVMQAPINARLGEMMGGPLVAAFLSFLIGGIALAITLIVMRKPILIENISQTSPWLWIGGLLGAFLVFSSIYAVPKIGALAMISLVVGGQILATLIVDHYGFLLPKPFPITPMRVMGALCLIAGIAMILWPKTQSY